MYCVLYSVTVSVILLLHGTYPGSTYTEYECPTIVAPGGTSIFTAKKKSRILGAHGELASTRMNEASGLFQPQIGTW